MLEQFKAALSPGMLVGIVGVGAFGSQLRELAEECGCHVLLCDPPRNQLELEDLGENFFALWGNGMGGCELTGQGMETFLPLDGLAHAQLIAIAVPLTTTGKYPTGGLVTQAFLDKCLPTAQIFCFSDAAVLAPVVLSDSRIRVSR